MKRPEAYRHDADEYRRAVDVGMHLVNIGADLEGVRDFARQEWPYQERFRRKCLKTATRLTIALVADRTKQTMTTDTPVDLNRHHAPSTSLIQ